MQIMKNDRQTGLKATIRQWDARFSNSKIAQWFQRSGFGQWLLRTKVGRWIARFGFLGFLFFLMKGLLWIAVWLGLGKLAGC